MTAWSLTLVATGLAAALGLRLRLLGVHAARVGHEARGPLCTALLGLERLAAAGSEPSVVGAVELELRRAALALDDLARSPARRAPPVWGAGGPGGPFVPPPPPLAAPARQDAAPVF